MSRRRAGCILGGLLLVSAVLSAEAAFADRAAALEGKPDIGTPDTSKYRYELVWYNHFDRGLYTVKYTNLDIGNRMGTALFRSWCNPFDELPRVHAKLLVAADEHFKIDYTNWTKAPFNLPALTKRWFEIMDDESWYIVELPK